MELYFCQHEAISVHTFSKIIGVPVIAYIHRIDTAGLCVTPGNGLN
jgi:hypothetical protein